MSTIVFIAVIGAALLHASWNALLKGSPDKQVSMVAVVLGQAPLGALGLLFVPAPAVESWPYLAVGVLLHLGYQFFLMQSYRFGDLTQVYPIARGSAPLIVAAISVAFLGVHLAPLELLAVVIIGVGIVSLGLTRRADGMRNGKAAGLALATGCFIASYSLVDGLGARAAGTSVGFYGWLTILNAILMAAFLRVRMPGLMTRTWGGSKVMLFVGGGASYLAYAIVTWSFTQAPIALVTALRETSIIFALLIGVFFLGEKLDLTKLISTMMTLLGAVLLRFAR